MASQTLKVPDLHFGFYFPEIFRSLIEYKRIHVPELTDESEFEPSIQFLRATALVGHENSCVMDMVAQESVLITARLAESVREHLRLIDYTMAPARPARAEVVCKVSKVMAAPSVIVPFAAQFSTARDPSTGVTIFFEANNQVSVNATNVLTKVLSVESGVIVDHTAKANSVSTPADDWIPWESPSDGDTLYICHDSAMWNRLDTFMSTETQDGGFGVWEYFSGDYSKAAPDSVQQVGNRLRFVVNGYLGAENRNGTFIRVQVNSTTISEDVEVVWTGAQNVIETTGLLGQSIVSLAAGDYTIGSDWEPLPALSSSSGNADLYFGIDEDLITWTLPQSVTDKWNKTSVELTEGYWIRFRWIEAPDVGPTAQYITIENSEHFVAVSTTQGQTITQSPLGSSTGAQNQSYLGSQSHFIDDGADELLVNSEVWSRVTDFVLSGPQDLHYIVRLTGADDRPEVVFGDGVRGKAPPVGVGNIEWTYRYGANNDGNVGPNTINVDRSGLSNVSSVFNPRQAYAWSAAEGSTDESIELAKQLGPATLRSKEVAVAATDLPPMTLRFVDDNGVSPYSRAFAIEESFGPKTVELVCVLKGGALASSEQLTELSRFFNGDKFALPPIPARMVSNQKVVATNYSPFPVNVKVKVFVASPIGALIENRLLAVLNPEATKVDGFTKEWEFGSSVARSRINAEIHNVSAKIQKVEIIEPANDISLSFRQLPTAGSLSIEIVSPT